MTIKIFCLLSALVNYMGGDEFTFRYERIGACGYVAEIAEENIICPKRSLRREIKRPCGAEGTSHGCFIFRTVWTSLCQKEFCIVRTFYPFYENYIPGLALELVVLLFVLDVKVCGSVLRTYRVNDTK